MKRVLVASVLAHAAVFAWLATTRPSPAPAPAPPAEDVAIEMVIDPEVAPAPTATTEAVAIAVAPRATSAGPAAPAEPSSPAPANAPPDAAPYASNGTIIVFAPNIGIGGTNPFLVGGVEAGAHAGAAGTSTGTVAAADPMDVPLNKRAEQSVKDALRARDRSIGLGLEGPVVHALEDATHAGFSPERGTATFLAVIDERGIVIDLKVLSSTASSSEGAHGWESVRQRAAKSLARARIDMRGVKRAELKIAVDSEVLLPSGNKPEGPKIHTEIKPARTLIETNAPPSPGGSDVVAAVEVAQFDVTDIRAKGQRVVHAKLVLTTTR